MELLAVKVLLFKAVPPGKTRRAVVRLGHIPEMCLGALLVQLAVLAWTSAAAYHSVVHAALGVPWPLNAMEGRETVKAWLLAHGVNTYPPLTGYPFLVTIYPPLYHVAIAVVAHLSHWDIAAGRLTSVVAFALTACVAALIVRRTGGGWLAAVSACLLIFLDRTFSEWSLHARPDCLAWLLALAATGMFWTASGSNNGRPTRTGDCVVAGILFCLAFFTKQQTLPYLLGCLIWAAAMRQSRKAALIAGTAAMLLGIVLAVCMQLTTGGGFLRDTVVYPAVMSQIAALNTKEFLITRLAMVWDSYQACILLFAV